MKLLDIWSCSSDVEDSPPKLGITWHSGIEGPFISRSDKIQPDRDYYSSFTIQLYFFSKVLYVTIRTGKMPYKNKEEYLTWRKSGKKDKSL